MRKITGKLGRKKEKGIDDLLAPGGAPQYCIYYNGMKLRKVHRISIMLIG